MKWTCVHAGVHTCEAGMVARDMDAPSDGPDWFALAYTLGGVRFVSESDSLRSMKDAIECWAVRVANQEEAGP
jgi:hypothetical protein